MDKDLEYYLNNQRSNCCVPVKEAKCLSKQKYLSEFSTDEEKAIARLNLGITEKLDELYNYITFSNESNEGNLIKFDPNGPTPGKWNYVLSSDRLSKVLEGYALKADVEAGYDKIWQTSQEEFTKLNSYLELLNKNLINLERDLHDQLKCMVRKEMIPFYHKYYGLQKQIKELKKLFETYVKTSNGVAITDKFGFSDSMTVSQKTLTEAINAIYNRIADLQGVPIDKVAITITPDYVITDEEACDVTITIHSSHHVFEHIEVFVDNEEVINADDVQEDVVHTLSIDKSVEIRVNATILGEMYQEEKTIKVYYPFFIGSGLSEEQVFTEENAVKKPANNEGINGKYAITVHNNGEQFFVIIPKTRVEDVGRIHMNGYDIPFDTYERDKYIVYVSKNRYRAKTYFIYIEK